MPTAHPSGALTDAPSLRRFRLDAALLLPLASRLPKRTRIRVWATPAASRKVAGPTFISRGPSEIGSQHGALLGPEIEDLYQTFKLEDTHESGKPWQTFRDIAKNQLWPHIEPEYRARSWTGLRRV